MASIGEYFFNDLNKNVPENMDPFSSETASTYSNIISLYIPYFNQLPGELKKVFLNRTHHFKTLKNFHYVGMEEQAEIPILISAAAVQLTLGLINYELPFFKNIYVTPDVYQTPEASELFVGHVAPSGIYLSWKYFLQGYADDTDNVNVAIHEMVHALTHESFLNAAAVDKDFKTDFLKFSEIYGQMISTMIVNRRSVLRSYAYTNFQEFWAVSVEMFFESPALLKQNIPELYEAICAVLNQDPLSENKILPVPFQ